MACANGDPEVEVAKGFDIGGLLGQAQALQEKLSAAQQDLAGRTVEGSAGGGMVRVVVNGRLEVVQVHIEPEVVSERDLAMLQDLVTAATNDGIRKAQVLVAGEMAKLTGGLGLKLPGFGS